jgi:hypothetical protein
VELSLLSGQAGGHVVQGRDERPRTVLRGAQEQVLKYEFDMAPACSVYPAPTWAALGLKTWKWPGDGLADDRIFQFVEQEVMAAEEYDQFLSDPDGFTARTIFPRTASLLEPLAMLPPLYWYFNFPTCSGRSQDAAFVMLEGLVTVGQEGTGTPRSWPSATASWKCWAT